MPRPKYRLTPKPFMNRNRGECECAPYHPPKWRSCRMRVGHRRTTTFERKTESKVHRPSLDRDIKPSKLSRAKSSVTNYLRVKHRRQRVFQPEPSRATRRAKQSKQNACESSNNNSLLFISGNPQSIIVSGGIDGD